MFRKPREATTDAATSSLPSVGRPPTPPGTPAKTPFTLAISPLASVPAPKMAVKTKTPKQVPLPTIGRQGPTGSAKKSTAAAKSKQATKANTSILSFFKKSDGPMEDVGLFFADQSQPAAALMGTGNQTTPPPEPEAERDDDERFNENGGAIKRRRTSVEPGDASLFGEEASEQSPAAAPKPQSGPFMEESDSEDGDEEPAMVIDVKGEPQEMEVLAPAGGTVTSNGQAEEPSSEDPPPRAAPPEKPPLLTEETSMGPDLDEFKDFEGMEDFDEDLFEEGDEFMERKYMEEQARLEEEDERDYDAPAGEDIEIKDEPSESNGAVEDAPTCPMCSLSLAGVDEQAAAVHVNNCLDGNPTPLLEKRSAPATKRDWGSSGSSKKSEGTSSANQFKRPVRAPKPGQASPFTLGEPSMNGSSAFGRLMSGHAEDAAWAAAAAEEHASRGKPAYQRTCPFYKILPGLFICVDAFRYGAVQGCQAYFLSHFHSDHYVGLTASWSHGPIYCSHVTANLVRQQLRVDPKWVVDLDFDRPVEVPGTKGVKVTMIPANHCPGSSLYLFEKVVGKKSNGEPRLQRILHCGDFRACRAHIEHPLLMPDVQDKLTGKTKEQKIDVCYLDTTYLNPKYAFPSQAKVIQACADMCVSLSKHTVDENDGWEQMKRSRAGEGMVKFVRKESAGSVKEEPSDEGEGEGEEMGILRHPAASQQILTTSTTPSAAKGRGRLLVVVGTYSIGKERICLGIARALDSKIYAPPSKMRIVRALEDAELDERMTSDPRAAQVHMTPLFEIRAETLDDYLKDYFPHFTRAVGFRPSGWNYRPPTSRFLESPSVSTVLNGENWKSSYSMKDLVPQRGSSSRASCFGVPYSEHSSFRELTMFCCALRIEKIIPTVNVGSAKGRERMKGWCERWAVERRKNGVWRLPEEGSW